ncbi:MAG: NADH-quinone oxidoreductase subunit N [Chloroflexi bacterium]|nr:NADH-quinone oxidoreductase subunit N [Chloroflexota bacterium]
MNFLALAPELLLTALAFVVLISDLFVSEARKHLLAYLSIASLGAVMVSALLLQGATESFYGGLLLVDGYTWFFRLFFPATAIFVILMSLDFVRLHLRHPGEYYGFILLATLGMMLMAAAGELLTAYISLELLNFSLYVLVAYAKSNLKSNEAGLKYILLSAFASAILLYGISLIYGTLRTTTYSGLAAALAMTPVSPGLVLGLALLIAGLGFKVAAVPFHMWTPDVYEGAPLPITALIAVAAKAAGVVLVLRLFAAGLLPAATTWIPLIALLAALTMTVGNLMAIQQRNIKRLLAYSSISQVGYLLVGVAALSPLTVSALVLYMAGYAAATLAAFLAVTLYYNHSGREDIADFGGLAERAPFLAFAITVAFFSLAGMPLFAGFTTKFYLFTAAAEHGLLWLVALAVLNSFISLYYYLVVIRELYVSPPREDRRLALSPLANGALGVLLLGVFLVGLLPGPLLEFTRLAALALGRPA